MRITVLDGYTTCNDAKGWSAWQELGCEFVHYDHSEPEQALERMRGSEIVITNKVPVTREIIEQSPALRYVGVLATGYNVVDVAAAREHGITVTNIPAYSTRSVAQLVFAHILNITNNVAGHASAVSDGEWQRSKEFCFWLTEQRELAGKTIGIVGLGNTGMQTALIALAFGMKVLAYTSKESLPEGMRRAKNLDEVFAESDIVSLHCPLNDSTYHIINAHTLSLMKPSAILINTGRGPLIDEEALAEALKAGRIHAAGIDVLTQEPPRNGSPLIGLANCFITPHIAWTTTEARARLSAIALQNVRDFLAGKKSNCVS